jgi:hypothetical protein
MVVHELGPEGGDGCFQPRLIAQVDAVDGRRSVDVVLIPGAEVVEDGDLMAGGDVGVDYVRADEPGSASHQNSHGD